jgi:hypothetical protein
VGALCGPLRDEEINLSKAEKLNPELEKILHEKTKGKSDEEKLIAITQLTKESVAFCQQFPKTSTILSIDEISDFGIGICVQRAEFFVALCKAAGIPARGVGGYLLYREDNSDTISGGGHKWAEVRLNNKWVALDPAAIKETTKIPYPHNDSLYVRFTSIPKEENLKSSERYIYEQFGEVIVTGIEKEEISPSKEKPLRDIHKAPRPLIK